MLLYQNVTITKRITIASTFTVLKHKLEYMTIKANRYEHNNIFFAL